MKIKANQEATSIVHEISREQFLQCAGAAFDLEQKRQDSRPAGQAEPEALGGPVSQMLYAYGLSKRHAEARGINMAEWKFTPEAWIAAIAPAPKKTPEQLAAERAATLPQRQKDWDEAVAAANGNATLLKFIGSRPTK